jgi:hypothetical protein
MLKLSIMNQTAQAYNTFDLATITYPEQVHSEEAPSTNGCELDAIRNECQTEK